MLLRADSDAPAKKSAKKASGKLLPDVAAAPLTSGQKILEANLRAWRKEQAAQTGKPAFIVFGDAALNALVQACPATIPELHTISGFGPDKVERYGAAICAICRGEAAPSPSTAVPVKAAKRPVQVTANHAQESAPTFKRERATPSDPSADLNPDQQELELRLRDWRKSESERIGLPQFFVLGTTALRSIVLSRPRTLSELREIGGIDREKLDRFGPNILELCNA